MYKPIMWAPKTYRTKYKDLRHHQSGLMEREMVNGQTRSQSSIDY